MTTAPVPTSSLPLKPGHWTVDKNHSGIFFVVRHLGLSNVRGRFDRYATLEIGSSLETVVLTAEVDLLSVDTNNADRDAHLRSHDFFDTDQHQIMTFHSTSIAGAAEKLMLGDKIKIDLDCQFVAP